MSHSSRNNGVPAASSTTLAIKVKWDESTRSHYRFLMNRTPEDIDTLSAALSGVANRGLLPCRTAKNGNTLCIDVPVGPSTPPSTAAQQITLICDLAETVAFHLDVPTRQVVVDFEGRMTAMPLMELRKLIALSRQPLPKGQPVVKAPKVDPDRRHAGSWAPRRSAAPRTLRGTPVDIAR